MDPLSLTVGAVALLGFCKKVLQGLQVLENLSQIPDDIAALVDELQDFHDVLITVSIAAKQSANDRKRAQLSDKLQPLLVKSSNILAAIASHCGITIQEETEYDAKGHVASSTAVATAPKIDLLTRFRWLKDEKKISQFRQRLEVVRLDISNYLGSLNLLNTYSILDEVRDLAVICRRLSADSAQSTVQLAIQSKPLHRDSGSEKTMTSYVDDCGTNGPGEMFEDPPPYGKDVISEMSSCSCACHRVSTIQTPQFAGSVFGQLQLRLGGIPCLTPACDQILCRKNKRSSMNVSFRLPSWFSNRTVNARLFSDVLMGPQLNLFSTRIISRNSDIFFFAMQGDIPAIKKLFSRGLASPHDATHNYGYTALHYAADYGHLDLCDFLVKAGAKPNVQDFNNHSATDLAYHKLVSNEKHDWDGERVQEIFDEETWLEQKHLTILHKHVLGIAKTSRSLMDELSLSVKDIDVGDCEGRTPLSWAAERGDAALVKVLLKFGANYVQGDNDANTPVHYACKAVGGPSVLKVLLEAGASPIKRNKWEQTPMNWVTFFQDDPEFVKCLQFHPGVSLQDDRDLYGSSLVGNAAFSSRARMLTFLLDNGGDPNGNFDKGESPLLDCISRNNHECISILLEKAIPAGLSLVHKDENNESFLHYLARVADLETIQIFHDSLTSGKLDISGVKTTGIGEAGLTARNILALRADNAIQKALEPILVLIDRETASEVSSVRSEEAAFVDAFELLPQLESGVGLKEPISVVYEVAA